ncbi:hypothetical protein [Streptomyces violascens]|uniref:hypothetical protein n=1 Tax=Streptomyces violascens TaxID=67381 RepID=UPI0036D006CF
MANKGFFDATLCIAAQAGDDDAAYFLSGDEYARFVWGPGGRREGGYVEGRGWTAALLPSIPHTWLSNIDAACVFDQEELYLFQHNKYLVYSFDSDTTSAPGRICDITPFTTIDAAVTTTEVGTGQSLAYLFSEGQVYTHYPKRPDQGELATIAETFPRLRGDFRRGIDSGVPTVDGAAAYLFHGRYFVEVDFRDLHGSAQPYGAGGHSPLPVKTTWTGLLNPRPAAGGFLHKAVSQPTPAALAVKPGALSG